MTIGTGYFGSLGALTLDLNLGHTPALCLLSRETGQFTLLPV